MEDLFFHQVATLPQSNVGEEGGPHDDPCLRAMEVEAKTPICKGSKLSRFSAILLLLNLQIRHQVTNIAMSAIFCIISDCIISPLLESKLPKSRGEAQEVLKAVGLDYTTIHACPGDCILYYGAYEHIQECPICHEPRYWDDAVGTRFH